MSVNNPNDKNNPFKGLASFETQDAVFYQGNENIKLLFLRQLADSNFVALLGDPGSGKTSLVEGFLASLALRFFTTKLPKPLISTFSPFSKDETIDSIKPSSTASISTLVNPVASETKFTMSDFIIINNPNNIV